MNKSIELMNLFWTTAGIFPGEGDISPYDFKNRVEAAARAGFVGIGLWHTDLEHVTLHRTLKDMKMILDDNGIKYVELEFLTDWFQEGGRKRESDSRKKRLFEASQALNAKHIKIGDFYNNPPRSLPQVSEAFAVLCREAADYGATIGLEFMSSAVVGTLKDAIKVVRDAGQKNGGIIIDSVQVTTLQMNLDEIRQMPLEYLVNVELDDGALPSSSLYNIEKARRFCGEGDFDIKGFIKSVLDLGYEGPWAIEVFSKELTKLPLDELNKRAFETTMNEFNNLDN